MKSIFKQALLAALASGGASAGLLVHDGFGYSPADLSGNNGGSGWSSAWTDTGNPVVVRAPGLTFSDAIGNVLATTGNALDTADGGAATTISAREIVDRDAETWISVLIQPQGSFTDFIGVSFYDQGLATANARFAIEHAGGKDLRLTRRAGVPSPLHTAAFSTTVGTTVLAVIHLVPDGGGLVDFPDRVDVFFNPALNAEPTEPHASAVINGLQFDRIRIAAQNGRSTLVDELRIGETFADVTPFTPAVDPDTDGDGLTDGQEATLGLDPGFPDTAFIAALKANPDFAGVHSTDEIMDVTAGSLLLGRTGATTFDYSVQIKSKNGTILETITRPLTSPPGKQFLRLYLNTP